MDKKIKELLRFSIFWMLGITTLYFGFNLMIKIANFTILMVRRETMSNQVLLASLISIFIYSLLIYLAFRFSNGYFKLATKKKVKD